jgi:hypothetical protein
MSTTDLQLLHTAVVAFAELVGEQTPLAAANKIVHEAEELVTAESWFAANPADPGNEAADVLITLLGWAHRAGWTVDELVAAARRKMDVNLRRKWALQPDGTFQHIEVPC